MFTYVFIFAFLVWILSTYLLFNISPFKKRMKYKKFFYISTIFYIIPILILLLSRNYSGTYAQMEQIYLIGSILICVIIYNLVLTPITVLSLIFLKKRRKALNIIFYIVLIVPFIFSITGFLQLKYGKKITNLTIQTQNENLKNRKFVFFADPQFTVATQANFAKRITNILKEINPEKIFIAGDMFNGEELLWDPIVSEMKNWSNVAPVYVVTGNHEFYGDYENFIKMIKEANFNIINNETINIDGINVLGLNYPFNAKEQENIKSIAIGELSNKKEDIIISHEPLNYIASDISEYSPTFVFAGHTHNGQFWPLNYAVKSKYGKFLYGKNIIKDTTFYTTSGFGVSFVANRLFNTPEIVVVEFK